MTQERSISCDLTTPVAAQTIVVSSYAPPQIGGTPSVMYELLRHFPRGSFVLLTRRRSQSVSKDDRVLKAKTIEMGGVGHQVRSSTVQLMLLPFRIVSFLRSLKSLETTPRNILAVYPELDFLLAACIVSWLKRIPLYVYLHDCIVESTVNFLDRPFARVAEMLTFGLASRVYSLSDQMASYYSSLGFKTDVLPHGVDSSLVREPSDGRFHTPVRVGFAGAVYGTNGCAIQELVGAKPLVSHGMEISFATPPLSVDYLRKLGVLDGIDCVVTLSRHSEVIEMLSRCDVLFLPMSHQSPFEKDLLTIFPTKVIDYWLAQRPILVYGPRRYAFVESAEKQGYAMIASERGPESIARLIDRMCSTPNELNRLVEVSRAMIDHHDSVRISSRLQIDLGVAGG